MEYITSDLHAFHRNMLRFCPTYRPYETPEEMNQALIDRWNQLVKPTDIMYHLGDVSMGKANKTRRFLDQLNGQKVFIVGNHDERDVLAEYGEVYDYLSFKRNKVRVVMCHYPIARWHHCERGAVHFYGHVHGNYDNGGRSLDVGWDNLGDIYRLDTLIEQLKQVSIPTEMEAE